MLIGRIVGLISCLLCAIPFIIVAQFGKDSIEPITFWAGDRSIKEKVSDVAGYNAKMAKLYGNCAACFAITGIICLISMIAGIVLLGFACTVGIYIAYRRYRKILDEFL